MTSRFRAISAYTRFRYEHNKCLGANGLPCTDLDPHNWANQTLQTVISTVGSAQTGQIVMTEGGTGDPENWPAQFSFESIGYLMQLYRLPGGNFWRWVAFQDSDETDPTQPQAVKIRGVAYRATTHRENEDRGLRWIPSLMDPLTVRLSRAAQAMSRPTGQ